MNLSQDDHCMTSSRITTATWSLKVTCFVECQWPKSSLSTATRIWKTNPTKRPNRPFSQQTFWFIAVTKAQVLLITLKMALSYSSDIHQCLKTAQQHRIQLQLTWLIGWLIDGQKIKLQLIIFYLFKLLSQEKCQSLSGFSSDRRGFAALLCHIE